MNLAGVGYKLSVTESLLFIAREAQTCFIEPLVQDGCMTVALQHMAFMKPISYFLL